MYIDQSNLITLLIYIYFDVNKKILILDSSKISSSIEQRFGTYELYNSIVSHLFYQQKTPFNI